MKYVCYFLILIVLLTSSCESESQTSDVPSRAHDHTNMNVDHAKQEEVKLKDDKLNAVYQQYILLTNALIKGNMADAKIASNAIETGAKEINHAETLRKSAAKIMSASELEQQRAEYSKLSNEFIALVKSSGLTGGRLYVDFCPMALNDSGAYWISNETAIKNPYYGDKMLTCGEIKDTIK